MLSSICAPAPKMRLMSRASSGPEACHVTPSNILSLRAAARKLILRAGFDRKRAWSEFAARRNYSCRFAGDQTESAQQQRKDAEAARENRV